MSIIQHQQMLLSPDGVREDTDTSVIDAVNQAKEQNDVLINAILDPARGRDPEERRGAGKAERRVGPGKGAASSKWRGGFQTASEADFAGGGVAWMSG